MINICIVTALKATPLIILACTLEETAVVFFNNHNYNCNEFSLS